MKILHVIQRYPPAVGGAEHWASQVARHQVRRGHQVRIATLDIVAEEEFWSDAPPADEHFHLGRLDLIDGVMVRRFRRSLPVWTVHHLLLRGLLDRGLGIYMLGPHSRDMLVHLRAEMAWCDVVHLHTLPYPHNAFGLREARRAGRPVLLTPHFHPGHPVYERRHQYRWMRRAQRVVVISALEKQELVRRGVPGDRIVVTGCGCDEPLATVAERRQAAAELRRDLGLAAGTAIICCVARKLFEKGISALAAAVVQLRHQGHQVALVLVGPDLPWFRTWWANRTAAERALIHDLGCLNEARKRRVLAGSDVFAMPSRYEAFGIVFLEAWAAGLPVVGGNDGAQRSVIGEGGATVPFDDPEATARALERFLLDPIAAAAAVRAGRQSLVARYRWDNISEQVLQATRELVPAALNVVTASSFYPPHVQGGAELACAGQVQGLARRGCRQHVFAGSLEDSRPRHAVADESGPVPVRRIRLHGEDLAADRAAHVNAAAAAAFGGLLQGAGADVVHLHNLAGLGSDLIHQAADCNLPVVMTLHDYWGICHRNTMTLPDGQLCTGPGLQCATCLPAMGETAMVPTWQRDADLASALQRVDLFLAPSRYLAGQFARAGVPASRIRVLPYGMDLEPFAGSGRVPRDGPLLFMGYLGAHKGLQVLLGALSRPEAAAIPLLIAGDGELRPMLEERVLRLGLSDRVSFLGHVSRERFPALLAACRALAVPSLWPENAPLTITEAMAAGRPVVASDLGGIPELVAHGTTGFLVPPGDEQALAATVARLFADVELARTFGDAGRSAAVAHGLPAVLNTLEGIYRQLRDGPRRRWTWPLPAVALAAPAGRWQDPVLERILRAAVAVAGRFHVVPWTRNDPGGRDPRRHLPPAVLLLTREDDLESAAEALALGIPFVCLCGEDAPLASLARDSGRGWSAQEPEAVGQQLGRWLAESRGPEKRPRDGVAFLESLMGSRPPLEPRPRPATDPARC